MSKRKNGDAGNTKSPAKKAKSTVDGKYIYWSLPAGLRNPKKVETKSGLAPNIYLGRASRVAEEGQTIGGVAFSLANAVTLPEALNTLSNLGTHLVLYFLPPPLTISSAKTYHPRLPPSRLLFDSDT